MLRSLRGGCWRCWGALKDFRAGSPLLCWPCLPVCKMGVFLTHLSGRDHCWVEVVDLAKKRTGLKKEVGGGGVFYDSKRRVEGVIMSSVEMIKG